MNREPTIFTVEGKGAFPVDMLRYDQCWPIDPESTLAIEHSLRPETLSKEERRRVRRVTLATHGWNKPTRERWRSFLWNVTGEGGS